MILYNELLDEKMHTEEFASGMKFYFIPKNGMQKNKQ